MSAELSAFQSKSSAEPDREKMPISSVGFFTDFPRISVPKSAFVHRSVPSRTNVCFQKAAGIEEKWWARQALNL